MGSSRFFAFGIKHLKARDKQNRLGTDTIPSMVRP